MNNSYRKKVRVDRKKRLKKMDSIIEHNKNQIKLMSKDLKSKISVESFHAIYDRRDELMAETREMEKVRNDLNDIMIKSAFIESK